MGMIILVLVAMCVATIEGRPQSVVTPDQRLDMLPPEELDFLLDKLHYKHLTNINNDYEEAFIRHEMHRRHIFYEHQRRRQKRSVNDNFEHNIDKNLKENDMRVPKIHFKDVWHNYIVDSGINNRKVVVLDNITKKEFDLHDGLKIKAFPLHLYQIGVPALFQSEDSYGYIIDYQNKELKKLLVMNEFTTSFRGCSCTNNTEDAPKTCACCSLGGCLCNKFGMENTCVQCGMESKHCMNKDHHSLKLESATAFTYHLNSNDPVTGFKTMFLTTIGNEIKFYTWKDGALMQKQLEDGRRVMSYKNNISQIFYAETYVDYKGALIKKRFIFTFESGKEGKQLYHEIEIDPEYDILRILSTRVWKVTGEVMKIIQSNGHIYIILCDYDYEINVYDFTADKYRHFDPWFIHKFKLEEPPLDVKMFKSHFDQNLLITMSNEAKIYQIKGNTFDLLQTMKPENPITKFDNIVPMKMKGCGLNEILLAVQGTVAIPYVWNGYNENYTMVNEINVPKDIYWSQAVSGSEIEHSGEVVVPGKSSILIINIKGHMEDLPNPVLLQFEKVQDRLEIIEVEFDRQNKKINKTLDILSHGVNESSIINGTITIEDSADFQGVLHTHEVDASRIMIDESITGQILTNEEYLKKLKQLGKETDELSDTVLDLEDLISDAVPKNINEEEITGIKKIEGGSVNITNLEVRNLNVTQALHNEMDFPLQKTIENFVRKDFPGIVKGRKIFPKNVSIFRLETDFLDDIPVNDLVTSDGEEKIAGATYEKGLFVKGDLSCSENTTVAGKDPNKIVCANNRIHRLGKCRFNKTLTVEGDLPVASKMVDGVNIDDLAHKTIKKHGHTVLEIPMNISQFIIVEGNIRTSTIMGVNITNFLDNIVLKNKPSNISGHLTYESDVIVGENLIVGGLINNKSFPEDYPTINDTHIDFGNKHFGLLETDHLNVMGLIDETNVEEFLTKTTNQTIKDTKVFDSGIDVIGDLDIGSEEIDGLNIASLKMISEMDYSNIRTIVFKRNLEVESLNFTGNLNGFNFKEVIDDLVFCDEEVVVIDSVKTLNNLAVKYADFHSTINNENIYDFVTTDKAQTINGQITFNEVTHFRSLDVNGTVDGVDIELLYGSALYKDKSDQIVTGKKIFSNNTTMNSLKVHQDINDIDFNRAITISDDQHIEIPQNFTNVHFENLNITNILLEPPALINGVDIDDFLKRRLTINGAQNLQGNIIIDCPVNGSSLHSERINDYDLDDLVNNIVLHDSTTAIINSEIIFSSMDVLGKITTKDQHGANGLSLAKIASKAFWLDGSQNNMPYANFELLEVNSLNVNGLVDNVDIEELMNDAVFVDDFTNITVTGTKTFTSGIHVHGDIVSSMVNGLNYSSDLLLTKWDQILTGTYEFNNINVMKDVILYGSFNEIDMEEFEETARKKENIIFNDTVILMGNTTIELMDVNGLFNNLMLYDTYTDAVCENTSMITGKFTFKILPKFTNLNIWLLNGEDFEHILHDVVYKDSNDCIFEYDVNIDGIISASDINVNETNIQGSLDRTDYESLFTEAIYISKDHNISAHWIFAGGAVIIGNLDVEILRDIPITEYLTIHEQQNIMHDLKFDQLSSDNVIVLGTVNGFNLTKEYENTLFGTGGEIVTGNKILSDWVVVEGDIHITNKTGRDVKVDVSEETVRIDQPNHAIIQGPLMFMGPLEVESFKVNGLVNSVDLDEMFGNAWYNDQPTNFSEPMVFEGRAIMEGALNRNISHNDYDIKAIHELGGLLKHYKELVYQIERGFRQTCENTVQMYKLMENSIYDADYLHFVTSFKSAGIHRSSTTFKMNDKNYLVVNWQNNCHSSIYQWDNNNNTFVHEQDFESGYAYNWIVIPYAKPDYVQLVMSAGWETNDCNVKSTTIWGVETNGKTITIQASQTLPPSIGLSVMDAIDWLKLNLYNVHDRGIIGYHSNEKGIFNLEEQRRDVMNKYVYGYNSYGSEIGFEVSVEAADSLQNETSLIVFENGKLLSSHILSNIIVDALALEQDGKVLLMLLQRENILDRGVLAEELYYITVYEYDFNDASFELMSYEEVYSSGSLVTFTAGNEASRLVFVTFIQNHGPIRVYALLGETMKLWTELPIYVPTWTLPFNIREPNGYDKPYLLLGWDDTQEVIILTMEMRGFTVPQFDETCHISERNMKVLDHYYSDFDKI